MFCSNETACASPHQGQGRPCTAWRGKQSHNATQMRPVLRYNETASASLNQGQCQRAPGMLGEKESYTIRVRARAINMGGVLTHYFWQGNNNMQSYTVFIHSSGQPYTQRNTRASSVMSHSETAGSAGLA